MNPILLMSYWEHFKRAKELAKVYPPENKERQRIEAELAQMQELIHSNKPTL